MVYNEIWMDARPTYCALKNIRIDSVQLAIRQHANDLALGPLTVKKVDIKWQFVKSQTTEYESTF